LNLTREEILLKNNYDIFKPLWLKDMSNLPGTEANSCYLSYSLKKETVLSTIETKFVNLTTGNLPRTPAIPLSLGMGLAR
jgi:hypothetical protein